MEEAVSPRPVGQGEGQSAVTTPASEQWSISPAFATPQSAVNTPFARAPASTSGLASGGVNSGQGCTSGLTSAFGQAAVMRIEP